MCGGMVGEVFHDVDSLANSINPMKQGMEWLTNNTLGKIPGVGKPLARLGDWGINHPAEVAALGAGGYAAYEFAPEMFGAGGAGAGGGGAGAEGAAVGTGSLDMGAEGAAAYDAELGGQSVLGGMGTDAAGTAAAGASTTSGFGGVGTDAAAAGTGDSAFMTGLHSLFGSGVGGGGVGMNLLTAKNALGTAQVLSSLYGMEQSRKLSKQASSQAISNAGLQAVQRSMAAQGYQGSGNMMQALSKYGADAYRADLGQQQVALSNTLSGMGLLTAGVGNLAGWGSTGKG